MLAKQKQKKNPKAKRPKLCYHAKLHGKFPFMLDKLKVLSQMAQAEALLSKILFLGLLNTITIGVSAFFVFVVVEREENRLKNMITGISGFGFFGPKMAVS